MKQINFNINLTALKLIGIIVTLIGCVGFLYALKKGAFVIEATGVIAMGLGSLGYRKHLTTKNINFDDRKDKK